MPHVTTAGKKHRCKPLRFIWKRFHQFNETNTLHLDDLNRNFAMNPFQGMPIKGEVLHRSHRTILELNDDYHPLLTRTQHTRCVARRK